MSVEAPREAPTPHYMNDNAINHLEDIIFATESEG